MSDEVEDQGSPRRKRGTSRSPELDFIQDAARSGHVKVEITPRETPQERGRRIDDESKDADLERWKDKVQMIFTLILLSVVVAGCLMILASTTRPEAEKKWAQSALALIVGGAVTRTYGREKR